MSASSVPTGPTRLLIISLQTLRNVVMDHITHIRLVDTHSERNRRHDHIHLFVQKLILICGPGHRIHPGMVGRNLDVVRSQQFRQLLHLFAAQAVDDTRLTFVVLDITYDLLGRIRLRTHFVEQIRTVERRFEHRRIEHTQILLDIHLHLRGCRSRQCDQRSRTDLVNDRADSPILWAEIVAPLRDTVCLVDCIKRDLYLT